MNSLLSQHFGNNRRRKAESHCPLLTKKCLLFEIEAIFGPNQFQCADQFKPPICEFDDRFHFAYMAQNYAIDVGSAQDEPNIRPFTHEIHTNNAPETDDYVRRLMTRINGNRAMWLNLQGNGLSEEYKVNVKVRTETDKWFFSRFPDPAPWERLDYFQ